MKSRFVPHPGSTPDSEFLPFQNIQGVPVAEGRTIRNPQTQKIRVGAAVDHTRTSSHRIPLCLDLIRICVECADCLSMLPGYWPVVNLSFVLDYSIALGRYVALGGGEGGT